MAASELLRIFDDKPWAAHLYVTEKCNLDCHYCNEYDNSLPHPPLPELRRWLAKIRELGVLRLGLQGGEPLMHPDIATVVRAAKELGFVKVSLATNGFLLTRPLLAELEEAGLDSMHVSVDRFTPVPSTRKSLKTVLHKLAWFETSRVRLSVSGVLFRESLEEMARLVDTCLDRGVAVQMRAVHDDLLAGRTLRDRASAERLLKLVEQQETLKRNGQKIHTNWNTLRYQKAMLHAEPVEWTCVAGYKYFFVSSTGRFWLCSQVRTDRHILEITPQDLLAYAGPKDCQAGCGVYCTVDTSLKVSHPLRYARIEAQGAAARALRRLRPGGPTRARDFGPPQKAGDEMAPI